jgi:thymidylate kinase
MTLIVFEGMDGSGKTFLCKKLAKEKGWVYLKTPPKSPSKIKCKNELEELERYKKGLLLNSKIIQKKLALGKTVVCDRYYGTYIVDCALLGVKPTLNAKEIIAPTKVIHLVASWETIVKRLKQKKKLSELEERIMLDKKVYEKVLGEFRELGYEEKGNED